MMFADKFSYFLIVLCFCLALALIFNHDKVTRDPPEFIHTRKVKSFESKEVNVPGTLQEQVESIKQKIKPVKLLVIAFPRSGSSLAGSILSAGLDTAYYYEPYHWQVFKHPNGTGVDLHFVKVNDKFISGYTNSLFDCKRHEIVRLNYETSGGTKKYERCYQSEKVVVKAIRLHANNMLPWIIDEDIKVIQLIRDPRAILNSQFKERVLFKEWTYHIDSLCKMMIEDDNLSKHLPSNRFAQLKYEDLVTNPVVTLIKLYKKLELDVDLSTIKAALRHLDEVPKKLDKGKNNWQSVYRGPEHNMNAWKRGIKKAELAQIEKKCKSALDYFGYKI